MAGSDFWKNLANDSAEITHTISEINAFYAVNQDGR